MGCGALVTLAPLALAAQQTTLRMDVKLVNVFVNVTGPNGAVAGGLTRNDFALAEDGRPQRIAVFEREPELPLSLTLAIDTSGSVRKDIRAEAGAARQFARVLLGAQELHPRDQMSVQQFAGEVRELTPFTSRLGQIDRGLGRLRPGSATALYDAICQGSERLGGLDGKGAGRRVLIVVSDGDDTAGGATYAQALDQALRNGVTIDSIIDVPIAASAGRDLGGEHALVTLADETGGQSFYVAAGEPGGVGEGGAGGLAPLDRAFRQVAADLRTGYLLGYYPHREEPGEAFHRIQVTLPGAASQAFQLRYRSGYYADSPGGGK